MENNVEKKNSSKGVIIILCIIIVILLALCTLFATGTISLKDKESENEQTNNDSLPAENNNQEAVNTVKEIFNNEAVQYLFNHSAVTYCDKDSKQVSEEELGLNYKWNGYQKCTNYNSYEELKNHFKQYVTDELLDKYLSQTVTLSNGTVMYKYYERDGSLYAANTGKGGNINKDKFLEDETIYEVKSFDNKQINATVNAKWKDVNDNYYSELVNVTIVKEDSKWKISSYEIEEE